MSGECYVCKDSMASFNGREVSEESNRCVNIGTVKHSSNRYKQSIDDWLLNHSCKAGICLIQHISIDLTDLCYYMLYLLNRLHHTVLMNGISTDRQIEAMGDTLCAVPVIP